MSEGSDLEVAALKAADTSDARSRERQLVRSALAAIGQGRPDTYARIVELYQHRVFNLVQMALRDRAAAEDIVQDAFIRAYTHLDMFDPERDFYPWLATIAMRLAYNCKRRAGEFVSDNANSHQNVATDSCLLEGVLVDERAQRLWHAVSALPSGERMAVVMFYRQDMKVEEIAQALGVTSGTVKTFLFRARAKLRCSMRGDVSSDDPMEPSK